MDTRPRTILLTGATGYVGGTLLGPLLDAGHDVRCLVRRPERADLDRRATVVKGDVVSGYGLAGAMEDVDTVYYLVHSMGQSDDFAATDRRAARNVAGAADEAGVERIVYLGGLDEAAADGSDGPSEHLRSRHEVAELLGQGRARLVYAQAAMVIGAGSASFQIVQALVDRLPLMLTPRWVDTPSQPIAIDDVVHALQALGTYEDVPDEAQLGGADVLSYRDMMARYAEVAGKRSPAIVPVPVLTPGLSSHWVSLFSPVDNGVVRPLVDGLSVEMRVRTPPPPGINDAPLGFDEAVRRALAPDTA